MLNSLQGTPVRRIAVAIVVLLSTCLVSASVVFAQEAGDAAFSFSFDDDAEGWAAGFADLSVDFDPATFELDSGFRALPEGLEGSGVYIQGHNRSDDLFMFLKRQVEGLRANETYSVAVSVNLATNVPAGSVGIGGSPGESVYVKAGASAVEPATVEDAAAWLRMNIDKGNQANGGESMVVMGNVANPAVVGSEYKIKTLDNSAQPLTATTDGEGRLWLIVGTDSGFEGLSTFYYARIAYTLTAVSPPSVGGFAPPWWATSLLGVFGALLTGLGASVLLSRRHWSRRTASPATPARQREAETRLRQQSNSGPAKGGCSNRQGDSNRRGSSFSRSTPMSLSASSFRARW